MFFLAFFTLSSFAPSGTSVSAPVIANAITATTSEAPKADKKARLMQKMLNTKVGKWALRKMQTSMEKRNAKLSTKLAIAEKAGDVKKVDKIKKQMAKKGNLKRIGLYLIVGGLIAVILGIVIAAGSVTSGSSSGFGLGGLLYVLGGLAILIGLIVLILGLLD